MAIEVSTYSELQAIENDLGEDYLITAEIDGELETNFSPIGNFSTSDFFTGTIDGQGYTLKNFTIDEPSLDRCGFIAATNGSGQISVQGLIFENWDVTGDQNVGTIAGRIAATRIERCIVRGGSVTGSGAHQGGIVGEAIGNNPNPGTVINSYSTGTVTGVQRVGGIAGYLHWRSDIMKCWSLGLVTATSFGGGGINGQDAGGGDVYDSFSDSTVGVSSGGSGSYKTTAEMQDIDTYTNTATAGLDEAWDMALIGSHTTEVWYIDDGNDYPRLSYELEEGGSELQAEKGSYTLSGKQADLLRNLLLSGSKGSFSIDGKSADLILEILLQAQKGSFSLSGKSADLLASLVLNAVKAGFSIEGKQASLTKGYEVTAEKGLYVIGGKDVSLIGNFSIPAQKGTYTLAGKDANLEKESDLTLVCEKGVFSLTGGDVNLLVDSILSANKGQFQVEGKDAGLSYGILLTAEKGEYQITQKDIEIVRDYVLQSQQGSYEIDGKDVTLLFTQLGLAENVSVTTSLRYEVSTNASAKYTVSTVNEIPYIVHVTANPKIKEHGDI